MTKNLAIKTSHLVPWEEPEEYETLFISLLDEHNPQGPTEYHLIEELAGIIWRKQRVGMAEAALHRHGLNKTFAGYSNTAKNALAHVGGRDNGIDVSEAVSSTPDKISAELTDSREDRMMVEDALEHARTGKYQTAIKALREDTREWWQDTVEDGEDDNGNPRTATAKSLAEWLELVALPWIASSELRLSQIDDVRSQAYGETLDPRRFNELGRWEANLDRKFERILTLLFKLQHLRREKAPPG
jgi:hypothetical protein